MDDCWSEDPLLLQLPTGLRFHEISWYLHFVNNEDLVPHDDPTHDRLGKVRPLIDHLSSKFATLYEPSKNVAVNEATIKFQGHSSLKQMKPIKFGSKVWVLGYFRHYTGMREHQEGLGAHVLKVTSGLKHKYHHVYCDNYFTSFQLT